jgi:hypothetical protein
MSTIQQVLKFVEIIGQCNELPYLIPMPSKVVNYSINVCNILTKMFSKHKDVIC